MTNLDGSLLIFIAKLYVHIYKYICIQAVYSFYILTVHATFNHWWIMGQVRGKNLRMRLFFLSLSLSWTQTIFYGWPPITPHWEPMRCYHPYDSNCFIATGRKALGEKPLWKNKETEHTFFSTRSPVRVFTLLPLLVHFFWFIWAPPSHTRPPYKTWTCWGAYVHVLYCYFLAYRGSFFLEWIMKWSTTCPTISYPTRNQSYRLC